jgi:hypothetical protein
MKLLAHLALALSLACLVGCGGGGSSGGKDGGGTIDSGAICTPIAGGAECVSCYMTSCSTQWTAAIGTGVETTDTGGACRDYINCVHTCGCTPTCTAQTCHGQITADCQNALSGLAVCQGTNCDQACAHTGP